MNEYHPKHGINYGRATRMGIGLGERKDIELV
jgi:hypothetical protein